MGLLDILNTLGNSGGQGILTALGNQLHPGQMGPPAPNNLNQIGSGLSAFGNAINGITSNPGLQRLAAQDAANRNNQYIAKMYAANPEFAKNVFTTQLAAEKVAKGIGGNGTPSAIQEYEYYKNLTPDQKREYLQAKRAEKTLDTGGAFSVLNPDGSTTQLIQKTLAPADQPDNAAAKAGAMEKATQTQKQAFEPQTAGMVTNAQEAAKESHAEDIAQNTKTGTNQADRVKSAQDANTKLTGNLQTIQAARQQLGNMSNMEMGPLMGRIALAANDPDAVALKSTLNTITLQAKDLLNMPGGNFSDADRDFLSQIAGGNYPTKGSLNAVLNQLESLGQNVYGSNQQVIQSGGKSTPSAATKTIKWGDFK